GHEPSPPGHVDQSGTSAKGGFVRPGCPMRQGLAGIRRDVPSAGPRAAAYYRLALILGALTAMGPLAIDMYLPALPAIAGEMGTGPGAVQISLSIYFVGIALGQAFYGPLSDRIGRKPALYIGLLLFLSASIG